MRSIASAPRRLLSSRPLPKVGQGGFFELRTDQIFPGQMSAYLGLHNVTASERQKLLPGWLGTWKTEIGGSVHKVHHLYHWPDYDVRDAARMVAEDHPMWVGNEAAFGGGGADQDTVLPLPALRERLSSSTSVVMLEATAALQSCGLPGAAGFEPPTVDSKGAEVKGSKPAAWELRQYQLVLGYPTVPKFLELYTDGLKDKLAADDSGASQLVSLLYSDNGPLNVVIELWRHESMQRAQDSRVASRSAEKWKSAIGEIAKISTDFRTEFIRPLRASPWQ